MRSIHGLGEMHLNDTVFCDYNQFLNDLLKS